MTKLTTIKVTHEVRARLAEVAALRGTSIRALVEELVQVAADATLLNEAGRQMEHLQGDDPPAWGSYVNEGTAWDEGTFDAIAS